MRLIVRGLGKLYQRNGSRLECLRDVSFDLHQGEFLSIVGPSGCGKSTLLKCIAGLIRPDTGSITFQGRKDGKRPLSSMVFQDLALFPWRTVGENISFGLEELKIPRKARRLLVNNYLSMMKMEGFERFYPHELSGGMRQRVAISRAMIMDPLLLLMDEPFSSLDAITSQTLQLELMNLVSNRRQSVIYVTHSIPEAVFLSDRVVVMTGRPGTIKSIVPIEVQRPRDLSFKTSSPYVRYLEELWRLLD